MEDTYVGEVSLVISNVTNPTPGGDTNQFIAKIGTDIAVTAGYSYVTLTPGDFLVINGGFDNSNASEENGTMTIQLLSYVAMPANNYV